MTGALTLEAAALDLGFTGRHLRDLINEGQIAAYDGRSPGAARAALRIERREIEAFKARRKVQPCARSGINPDAPRASGGTKAKAAGTMISASPAIDFAARRAERLSAKPKSTSSACGRKRRPPSARVLAFNP
jgi:hypothetical protein